MSKSIIRDLFDPSRSIDRRIEKVITYAMTTEDLLEQEIREYVATESIQEHFEKLLDNLEEGITGGRNPEVGVWVSGFYGSGKSSFTKYLGFALDPAFQLRDRPFRDWLQAQIKEKKVQQRLSVVAKKCPAVVIMVDLASEQLAGASLGSISTILYAKVMQWAGYARDEKMAYLEFMLERDGKLDAFKKRIRELTKSKEWEEIRNQPLVTKAVAARAAVEFYPEFFPDTRSFNEIRLEERIQESDRVKEMLELIKRRSGQNNVLFILDEVGQYIAASDDRILNLDGLAKNVKNIGRGSAWIIATAQQTLTEDDPRAVTNSGKLFKLKDRFPIGIDLPASDISQICYNRLLGKSPKGQKVLEALFEKHGPECRHSTDLKNTRFYRAELTKETFCRFYPFLPHHFDILLQLLARLARTRGGIGLRSAIKVIQDILTDPGAGEESHVRLADAEVGTLATAVMFFDTLRQDIRKSFPHIVEGVEKVTKVFGNDSVELRVAKAIGVLQILEDFPVSRENLAALIHPAVTAPSAPDEVNSAVENLIREDVIPINEVDGSLRFMSAAVLNLELERNALQPTTAETRKIINGAIKDLFTPLPDAKLDGARQIRTGIKVVLGSLPISVNGDKETIQTLVEFAPESRIDAVRSERIADSQQRSNQYLVYLVGHEDPEIDDLVVQIHRSQTIFNTHRNKSAEKDVEDYVRGQDQQAGKLLSGDLPRRLKNALMKGSFVFRGTPQAVATLSSELQEASCKHLAEVAGRVYEKYSEAPIQAASGTAEGFLKTEHLQKIASKDDPLGFVFRKGSNAVINAEHKALVSIRNYLEQRGMVDGRKILDDFFEPPFGWSKDTTRYLVAALLVAGLVKLRVAGTDVTTRAGEVALNSLKNTNAFNKISVALRNQAPPLESLNRARERLLKLTGQEVLPLEEEISRCVIRHFPDYQQDFAPLRTKLETLDLPGQDRAQNVQDNLSEILKGDASDATARLGGEDCPFFDDLQWARAVRKAFENDFDKTAGIARNLLKEIPALPPDGPPGDLVRSSEALRTDLHELLSREDFHSCLPEIQQRVNDLKSLINQKAVNFIEAEKAWLAEQIGEIQRMPEWSGLGQDEKGRLTGELENLTPKVEPDLGGMRRLLNSHYSLDQKIKVIQKEIRKLAVPPEATPTPAPEPPPPPIREVNAPPSPPAPKSGSKVKRLQAPRAFATVAELEQFIDRLNESMAHLKAGGILHIDWN